jgi:hypothetical protein
MVDVKIRKGVGKKAELRRMGHLTMEDRDGLQEKLKRLSFQRQFGALKRASWSDGSTTT